MSDFNNCCNSGNIYQLPIKGAGIIPYCIKDNDIYFLLQRYTNPKRKNDVGWNDFGGKRDYETEMSHEIAAREFSEETSCMFYLSAIGDLDTINRIKSSTGREELVDDIKTLISESTNYFADLIETNPIYIYNKDIYMIYFVNVAYADINDIPECEDIHINYHVRYRRECKWFTIKELLDGGDSILHRRLRILGMNRRLRRYHDENRFKTLQS